MIWFSIGVMLLAAIAVVTLPLYRRQKKISATVLGTALGIVAVALGMYLFIGSPSIKPATSELPDIEEMVASLDARLQENPDDLAGWKMLGRSYLELRRFSRAIAAFQKAVELEEGSNAQTLADLGEVMLLADRNAVEGRAADLFESALALAPNNPKALFYGGMVAIRRGDNELAASRWEALLATSPPENVREILRERVAELRGRSPDVAPAADPPAAAAEAPTAVVSVRVELSDAAVSAAPDDATVFIIARDPAQPSPPIAAVRRKVSELPAVVEIGDADAMIPGRVPSGFAELEIVARVSMTGQPIAREGDWFGDRKVQPKTGETISIVIDRQVP